jgi:hypothetical protein
MLSAFNTSRQYILKLSDHPFKSYNFLNVRFYRCKNIFTKVSGLQIYLIPGAGLNFLIEIRYAHARF